MRGCCHDAWTLVATVAPDAIRVTLDLGVVSNERIEEAQVQSLVFSSPSALNPFVVSPGLMALNITSMMLTPKFTSPLLLCPEP